MRAGFPFVHQLCVANPNAQSCRVAISLEVHRGDWPLTTRREINLLVPPGKSVTQADLQMQWNYDLSFLFRDIGEGCLNLIIQSSSDISNQPIHRREIPLQTEVLCANDWYCGVVFNRNGKPDFVNSLPYYRFKCSLPDNEAPRLDQIELSLRKEKVESVLQSSAALVIPEQARIREIVLDTFQSIQRSKPTQNFDPISLLETSEGRIFLMEALYATLLHEYNFFHTVECLGFDKRTQRIRLAQEIFAREASEVTCIDLALAYCALCERIGLHPLLIIVANDDGNLHSLAGCWTRPPAAPGNQVLSLELIREQTASLDPEMWLIDITEIANKRSFSEAWQKAKLLLDRTDFGFALDIKTNRIPPLPWHANPLLCAYGFDKKYLVQLKERVVRELAPDHGVTAKAFSPEEIYVPLKYKSPYEASPGARDILEHLNSRLRAGAKRVAILGNAGTGKSYLLGRFLLQKAREYGEAPDEAPIPVLFPLSRFVAKTRQSLVDQMKDYLQGFGYPVISTEEFLTRIRNGDFIFLLDALDELMLPTGSQVEDYINRLNSLLKEDGAAVILTARSGLFAAQASRVLNKFEIVELVKWDETSWREFLTQCEAYRIISHDDHEQFLNLTSKPESYLKDLISKPFFSRMLVETRQLVLAKGVINNAELLQLYTEDFLDRKVIENDFLGKADKIKCMQRTAFYMEQEHKRVLELKEISGLLNKKYPHLASYDDWQRYLLAIKVYGFLDNNLTDAFYFSHEVFREFFLATKFLADLFEPRESWQDFGQTKISREVAKLMAQLLKLENDSSRKQKINEWTKRSQKDRKNPSLWLGGQPELVMRNLVLIRALIWRDCTRLALSTTDFSNLDLSAIDFAGSALRNSLFIGSNLQHCSFKDAELSFADFSYCLLNGADFHNANLKGANFTGARVQSEGNVFSGARNINGANTSGMLRE